MDIKQEIEKSFRENCDKYFGEVVGKIHVTKTDETEKTDYYLLICTTRKNGKDFKIMQVYYFSKTTNKVNYTPKIVKFPIEMADEIGVQICE